LEREKSLREHAVLEMEEVLLRGARDVGVWDPGPQEYRVLREQERDASCQVAPSGFLVVRVGEVVVAMLSPVAVVGRGLREAAIPGRGWTERRVDAGGGGVEGWNEVMGGGGCEPYDAMGLGRGESGWGGVGVETRAPSGSQGRGGSWGRGGLEWASVVFRLHQ